MDIIKTFFEKYLTVVSLPKITVIDVLEILIIAFALYHIIIWVKKTRAWMLVKGIIVLCIFCIIAIVLDMSVILWIFKNTIGVGITAIIIVFQPELRKALEQLGRKNYISSIIPFDDQKDKYERFSDRTISEIVRATFEMAKTKTGALIVIERDIDLNEYERTGIILDSVISSQLLINIFEHNTPLHDGAIIIRGNRIVAATCYLPLSDNMELSKDLGTRHRAGVGISEVTDSITIIVSEETGKVSIASEGVLKRSVDGEQLKEYLTRYQKKKSADSKKIKLWKGRKKNERKADE
ncbi:diadenylate cyclase CdaA [Velocimicrobium porci]|uniref:Diadenylate cyclase n=1 Tax=Velocimicrobium porci TaxID=2606634 RepID=A0A6L5XUZ5_9FIRM|nr:diadenylate cyclase CdaA [Velocimicrobium porci]MSS62645.1 TIGR00159 family protein [Velocimicrobium porci]